MKSLRLLVFFAVVCNVFSGNCDQKCMPNTHFIRGCSPCTCTKDGEIVCTERSCPMPPPVTEPPFRCKPGSTFMRGCNTCTCSDDGTSAGCTEIGCPVRDS